MFKITESERSEKHEKKFKALLKSAQTTEFHFKKWKI